MGCAEAILQLWPRDTLPVAPHTHTQAVSCQLNSNGNRHKCLCASVGAASVEHEPQDAVRGGLFVRVGRANENEWPGRSQF